MSRNLSTCSFALVAALFSVACRGRVFQSAGGEVVDISGEAVMRTSSGKKLGTLSIRDFNGAARFFGTLEGVPTGLHGIHLHAVGICDAPTFEGAGGHFNPRHRKHGLENPAGPHAGDAPNLESNDAQRATVDFTFAQPTSNGSNHSGLWDPNGAAIVIHADPDDQKTDPAGNSGARMACGVVTRVR